MPAKAGFFRQRSVWIRNRQYELLKLEKKISQKQMVLLPGQGKGRDLQQWCRNLFRKRIRFIIHPEQKTGPGDGKTGLSEK